MYIKIRFLEKSMKNHTKFGNIQWWQECGKIGYLAYLNWNKLSENHYISNIY